MIARCQHAACLFVSLSIANAVAAAPLRYSPGEVGVVRPADAGHLVNLAATELQRYAYLRTGALAEIRSEPALDRPAIRLRIGPPDRLPTGGLDPTRNHAIYVDCNEPLRIGAYRDPGRSEHFPFRGRVDEVHFYNRALTDREAKALTRQ